MDWSIKKFEVFVEFISRFETLINNKEIKIGIVGLGYVGLPLMLSFAEKGYSVIGFDIDEFKVNNINEGRTYIKHIEESRIKNASKNKLISATNDFSKISEVDAIILCVPTPLNKYREPDMSYIVNTMDQLLPYIKKGQLISLESTTYPGTCDEILKPSIDEKGFKIGEDFFLCYSPEREDPGNKNFNTATIPKVLGGTTKNCLNVGKMVYEKVITKVIPVSSTKAAELTKLLENIYRCVNIGLINEMKVVADKMGIDIWEVIEAASSKPFGFTPFYPGPGLGGHCIPIDPFYLTWKAREYEINTKFIEIAGEVNTNMPFWVVSKIAESLNAHKKPINGSKILVLGITYKKNIDDMRESPSVKLMDLLSKQGALVSYHDPFIPSFPKMRAYKFDLKSEPIETLRDYDCVVVASDHDSFDYEYIQKNAKLIVDTRGRYRSNYDNVFKA